MAKPKSWKARTEKLRETSRQELVELLISPRKSARIARWIYENLAPSEDENLRIKCLEAIGGDVLAPWAEPFLLRELQKHKGDVLGDWVVIALTRAHDKSTHAQIYIDLYEDDTAHPMTRGSAICALNNCVFLARCSDHGQATPRTMPLDSKLWRRIHEVCLRACSDENTYARACGGWLAQSLGYDEVVQRLKEDKSPVLGVEGCTVASYIS